MLRVQEVVKSKGHNMQWLASQLKVSRASLYARLKSPKLKTLIAISNTLECTVTELLKAPKGYAHFYHEGVWYGIRKL